MTTPPNHELRVETQRSGCFVFQTGADLAALELPMQRVKDAHDRFIALPLSQVANRLEHEVVVSSIFGANTIEGGTLSEEETEVASRLWRQQAGQWRHRGTLPPQRERYWS